MKNRYYVINFWYGSKVGYKQLVRLENANGDTDFAVFNSYQAASDFCFDLNAGLGSTFINSVGRLA